MFRLSGMIIVFNYTSKSMYSIYSIMANFYTIIVNHNKIGVINFYFQKSHSLILLLSILVISYDTNSLKKKQSNADEEA